MARRWISLEDGPVELRFSLATHRIRDGEWKHETQDEWLRETPGGSVIGEYYVWDPSVSLDEVLDRWAQYGAKVYSDIDKSLRLPSGEYFEAFYPWEELWPHRRDDRPINPVVLEGLKEHGWLSPLLLMIGKNRCIEVGEGNHRLAIAKKLDLQYVPVRFAFRQNAHCVSEAERRERRQMYEAAGGVKQRQAEVEDSIRFYTERGEVEENPPRLRKVKTAFDEEFEHIERQFPDFGELELHHDERAGGDAGAGASRQFAYCTTSAPYIIAFAAKAEKLPPSYIRGLMRHEMGHALDHRYGKKEMEKRLGTTLPKGVEKRADAIAAAVWGAPIEYGDNDVQCIGCGGKTERPKHLHQNPGGNADVDALIEEIEYEYPWARPNKRALQMIVELSQPLEELSDADVEKAVFGVSSMGDAVEIGLDEVEWDPLREGAYEDVMEEVEEIGPEVYDLRHPIIVDVEHDGRVVLNDGHHRYIVAQEYDHVPSLPAQVQFSKVFGRGYQRYTVAKNILRDLLERVQP